MTEKAFVAAAAGAIPIYSGPALISKFMNRDRLIFWNASVPDRVLGLMTSPALDAMRSLPAVDQAVLLEEAERVAQRVKAL